MATLELLREADMVLNACGRPVPPKGYKFVDLPRVIPFFQNLVISPVTPFQGRIANTADTVFICTGVGMKAGVGIRLRWPDGKFLNQFPSVGGNAFPFGQAGNMLALDVKALDPGARISVEMSSFNAPGAALTFLNKTTGTYLDGLYGSVSGRFVPGNLSPTGKLITVVGNPIPDGLNPEYAQIVGLNTSVPPIFEGFQNVNNPQTLNNGYAEAVDLSGTTLIVGAPGQSSTGKAYIFIAPPPGVFVPQQTIVGSDSVSGDNFGGAVSVFGDTAAVSAVLRASNLGGVYVFNRTAGVWSQTAEIIPSDAVAGDEIGAAVLLYGTNLFISTVHQATSTGAVYWYSSASGTWTLVQKLTGPSTNAQFGTGISFDGTTLVIGAPGAGTGGQALVYQLNTAGLFSLVVTLVGSDTAGGDQFGTSVSVAGDLIAVGAREHATNGAAYLFQSFNQVQEFVQTDATGGDLFGETVQLFNPEGGSTAYLMVGAPRNGFDEVGAAYFYQGPVTTPVTQVEVALWGYLRYLLKDSGAAQADCVVGYPTVGGAGAGAVDAGTLAMIPNPIERLARLPRIKCGADQNIMAPEFLLGEQEPDTPDGFIDEAFTWFSPPITVPVGGQNYGNAAIVPGQDDVIVRWVSGYVTYSGDLAFTIPTFSIRLPNGYALTGGDMIPLNLLPGGSPMFPTLRLRAGDRVIIDMADMLGGSLSGSSTTVLQFDGVKRRKKRAGE